MSSAVATSRVISRVFWSVRSASMRAMDFIRHVLAVVPKSTRRWVEARGSVATKLTDRKASTVSELRRRARFVAASRQPVLWVPSSAGVAQADLALRRAGMLCRIVHRATRRPRPAAGATDHAGVLVGDQAASP